MVFSSIPPPPPFDYGSSVRWYVDGEARCGSIAGFRGMVPEVALVEMNDGSAVEVPMASLESVEDSWRER